MNANGTYKNPMFGLYQAMVPVPNPPIVATQAPGNNYYRAAEPDPPHPGDTAADGLERGDPPARGDHELRPEREADGG